MKKMILGMFIVLLIIGMTNVMAADTVLSISYTLDDAEIRPGGETTVTFTLTNPSASVDIDSIKLYLSSSDLEISPTIVSLGGIEAAQTKDVKIIVGAKSDAITKIANLNARFTYYAPTSKTATTIVPIQIKKLPTLQILETTFDKHPGPGSTVTMNLSLKNNGDGSAKDIAIELNSSDIFIAKTNDAFITSLGSYEKKDVMFELTIDPDTEIGAYSVPIKITYYDEKKDNLYTLEKYIGLKVAGQHKFIINTESQAVLTPGGVGMVVIEVSNAGNAPIKYLSAGFSDDLVYVGEIDSDDYSSIEVNYYVPSDIGWGSQEVEFIMSYKDSFDTEYEETYKVDLYITDPFSNIIVGIIGFIFGLVPWAIGLYVLYWLYNKFIKKKKPVHEHHHETKPKRKRRRRR